MFCNIAAKRVETRCCAFYRLQFKPVLLQIMLLQVAWILRLLFRSLQEPDLFSEGRFDSWVVKRATSLFNSFFSNVAKQVEGFCCPFIPKLKNARYLQLAAPSSIVTITVRSTRVKWTLCHLLSFSVTFVVSNFASPFSHMKENKINVSTKGYLPCKGGTYIVMAIVFFCYRAASLEHSSSAY